MKLRQPISTAHQKVSAVVATRNYLLRLTSPQETPRIPREVRREARALLRHYPIDHELKEAIEQYYEKQYST